MRFRLNTLGSRVKTMALAVCLVIFSLTPGRSQIMALPHAFAHNDYKHPAPLYDALGNGFTHIEADVYLRGGKLLVSHNPPFLHRHRTIQELYLDPLYTMLMSKKDQPQTAMDSIVLMVDIKSRGRRTYAALKKVLEHYRTILSTRDGDKINRSNLTVVLSGHRPLSVLSNESSRMVFADEDLLKVSRTNSNPEMFTMASCKYSHLIKWRGKGELPAFEKLRLEKLVSLAHTLGTKVRLWASPENERVWTQLRNCGVDLINTDKLVALRRFFSTDAFGEVKLEVN